jgi:tetratricopeptide (TPR) repeat protein
MLLLIACSSKRAAAQDQLYKPPYTTAEYNDFQAAEEEKNSQNRIKLLDKFSAKYPDSTLVPKIYQDYYQDYFSIKDYRRTVEYADKFLALRDSPDLGDRLDALMTRAQAFLAGCGEAEFQTPESYVTARTAAVQGLQTVSQFEVPRDGLRGTNPEVSVLPEREHLEALFYTEAGIAESGLKGHKDRSCSTKKIEIENIRLFSRQLVGDKRKSVEFQEFQEAKDLRLLPSDRFTLICELKGEPEFPAGDFLLWTAVEFFVAPVTPYYEKMKADQIDPKASWNMSAEIQDLKPLPIYSFHPGETRWVVINGFDLAKVLPSFPKEDPDNLWPWFLRIRIHVQDRTGRQIGSAERIIHVSPDSVRRNTAR